MAETVEDKLNSLVARVGKVRRWLVALAILKVAALCLIFVSVYIGVYAWLDHRLNFDEIGRIIAFTLLIASLAFLLYRLTKSLLGHVSYSRAATYIENRNSFHQQLVTAIEYYEKKQDYPYSRALAEQLVLQIDKDSKPFKFDSTVEKWRGYVFAAIILFGLSAACFYIRDNYIYFSSYFARLTRPLSAVEPLAPTSLESITKDIIAEPESVVTFAAEIKGRVPEFGKLVLVGLEPQTADNSQGQKLEEMQIKPSFDAVKQSSEGGGEETPRFEASKSFSQTGQFKYRFETQSASTDWHKVIIRQAPGIKSIMADIMLPTRPPRRKRIKPYTEQIEDHTLEVIPRSSVMLSVQSTDNLREVGVTGLDGKSMTKQLDGANQFTFSFTADRKGSIKFHLVSEHGLATDNLPDLEVIVKADEPPKFKLISPDGDYLATDVASVPITFEVTDDFGLDSIEMYLEIPGQQPKELVIPVEEGVRSRTFTHTIELERYDLTVGDSILFYAKATDIDTGSMLEKRTSSSDVYFIEIRPYRQNWRPKPGGGEGQGGGGAPVELLNILEYTRAILKKTWSIANNPYLTGQDRSRLEFINNDVQYCAEQLESIRDDPDNGFDDRDKSVLDEVMGYYKQASEYLAKQDATSAIAPEKNAYQVLRKFIIELEMTLNPPESGQGQQEQKPDSIKLQEQPEFSEYEKERIEGELKKLQQKLEKLTQEQKHLKRTFVNFLEQQAEEKKLAQQTSNGQSSTAGDEKQGQDKGGGEGQSKDRSEQKSESASGSQSADDGKSSTESPNASKSQSAGKGESASSGQNGDDEQSATESPSSSKGQSAGKGKSASGSQKAEDGQSATGSLSASKGQSAGKGKSASGGRSDDNDQDATGTPSTAQSQGIGKRSIASAESRLKMLQARQRALQEQVSQLKRDLQQLAEISEGGKAKGREEMQKHLDEAVAKMNDFQTKLTEARYQADMDERTSNEAVELLDSAKRKLELAEKALEGELTLSDEERIAKTAQEIAEQLAEDADALDESVTPVEREQMLARLEAAKRLLESMSEPQWTTVSKGSTRSGAARVFTKNPYLASAEAARALARRFWSIAVNAKKHQGRLIEDEPSDVKFYGLEKEFFENAAKFNQKPVQK